MRHFLMMFYKYLLITRASHVYGDPWLIADNLNQLLLL